MGQAQLVIAGVQSVAAEVEQQRPSASRSAVSLAMFTVAASFEGLKS
jgi:hypothetical protein